MAGSLDPKWGCDFQGCERHPGKGDLIIRVSSKGTPFVGLCQEHIGHRPQPEPETEGAS